MKNYKRKSSLIGTYKKKKEDGKEDIVECQLGCKGGDYKSHGMLLG